MSGSDESLVSIDGLCNFTALRRASRYVTAVYDQALAPANLRITQFSILYQLAKHGPMTIGDLADRMAMDRTTLSTNVKLLQRDGLVGLVAGEDRRAKLATITKLGLSRYKQAFPLWNEVQSRFECGFGKQRAERLRRELRLVLRSGFDPWAENTAGMQHCADPGK
ncbi:MarR family winged helix-turn-helix transcriptional regulator [Bordetella flabilis]|uniref:MarR family transcriptional regulator n=1 Tax=Bordetella flabilis TaxID=463014 RepID=A0A193GII7_9BORD|nr:MarR family winged helix-turn-helix transcriptional regulator [Bordetella flabilis]ANN79089.1 MarR family transcriptional regulator [Bordetella flabilis]